MKGFSALFSFERQGERESKGDGEEKGERERRRDLTCRVLFHLDGRGGKEEVDVGEEVRRESDRFKAINVFFCHTDFTNENLLEEQDEKACGWKG